MGITYVEQMNITIQWHDFPSRLNLRCSVVLCISLDLVKERRNRLITYGMRLKKLEIIRKHQFCLKDNFSSSNENIQSTTHQVLLSPQTLKHQKQ